MNNQYDALINALRHSRGWYYSEHFWGCVLHKCGGRGQSRNDMPRVDQHEADCPIRLALEYAASPDDRGMSDLAIRFQEIENRLAKLESCERIHESNQNLILETVKAIAGTECPCDQTSDDFCDLMKRVDALEAEPKLPEAKLVAMESEIRVLQERTNDLEVLADAHHPTK